MDLDNRNRKRSPLKEKPLHNPGESLEQEWNKLLYQDLAPYIYQVVILLVIVSWEWWRWYWKIPPQPYLVTLFAMILAGYSVYRIFKLIPHLRAVSLGLEGEKAVGQQLNLLQGKEGYRVFHDIPAKGFNIDHVIVSTRGIYVIETKTFSKPVRGDARVTFDGEQILVDGNTPERDPIRQVLALRGWLHDLLLERTGKQFAIRAVVVFPGWYTETNTPWRKDIWVLNPKGLPSFIEKEPVALKSEDVALITNSLSLYVQHYE